MKIFINFSAHAHIITFIFILYSSIYKMIYIIALKSPYIILIETLMGPSVPPRRKWLLEHSEEAED
jgi:hypothetical protein